MRLLEAECVHLDDAFYSYSHPVGVIPHLSGPSLDRKPSPYHLLIAAARIDLALDRSWMIGDRDSDIACAHAVGVRGILLRTDRNQSMPSLGAREAASLPEAAEWIVNAAS